MDEIEREYPPCSECTQRHSDDVCCVCLHSHYAHANYCERRPRSRAANAAAGPELRAAVNTEKGRSPSQRRRQPALPGVDVRPEPRVRRRLAR